MKETKITINRKINIIGHTIYLIFLAYLLKIKINKIKNEKNRIILFIFSDTISRDKFIKLIPGKFNVFEVSSINYLY